MHEALWKAAVFADLGKDVGGEVTRNPRHDSRQRLLHLQLNPKMLSLPTLITLTNLRPLHQTHLTTIILLQHTRIDNAVVQFGVVVFLVLAVYVGALGAEADYFARVFDEIFLKVSTLEQRMILVHLTFLFETDSI